MKHLYDHNSLDHWSMMEVGVHGLWKNLFVLNCPLLQFLYSEERV